MSFLADILLPPASLAALALLLLLVGGRRGRVGAILVTSLLILLGIPIVSTALLNTLAPPAEGEGAPPEAIVILSADGIRVAGLHDVAPGPLTLDRLRAGAALARRTGLPVLVAGGAITTHVSLAGMMAESLREDFDVPVRWQEDRSRTTWENAAFSAAILKQQGIHRVYLVTHFWHMRRALLSFRAAGLDPVAAPVRPPYWPPLIAEDLLLKSTAWYRSYLALHEWVGVAYYSLRQ